MTPLPRSRALTVEDLEAVPDDGHRYELISGTLIVSPAPNDRHQAIVLHLSARLLAVCPADLRVRTAPYDVVLAPDTVVQPDVLVARHQDIVSTGLRSAPVLAVEVLSPSTRSLDLLLKMDTYRRAGVAHYWIIDPDEGPRLQAWELRDGNYVEVADVSANDAWQARSPFPLTILPADLVD